MAEKRTTYNDAAANADSGSIMEAVLDAQRNKGGSHETAWTENLFVKVRLYRRAASSQGMAGRKAGEYR